MLRDVSRRLGAGAKGNGDLVDGALGGLAGEDAELRQLMALYRDATRKHGRVSMSRDVVDQTARKVAELIAKYIYQRIGDSVVVRSAAGTSNTLEALRAIHDKSSLSRGDAFGRQLSVALWVNSTKRAFENIGIAEEDIATLFEQVVNIVDHMKPPGAYDRQDDEP